MKLLGRAPTAAAVQHLLARTAKNMRHSHRRFLASPGPSGSIHLMPGFMGETGVRTLNYLPPTTRVGSHAPLIGQGAHLLNTSGSWLIAPLILSLLSLVLLVRCFKDFLASPSLLSLFSGLSFRVPYFSGNPTCVWIALKDVGFSSAELFDMNIRPWTTEFSRVDLVKLPPFLKLYYRKDRFRKFGHVESSYFPGAKLGFSPRMLRRCRWAEGGSYSIKDSFLSSPIAALGGTRLTLTQVPTEAKSSNITTHWTPQRISSNMLDRSVQYGFRNNRDTIVSSRVSEYERHYPRMRSVVDLPETFNAVLDSIRWFTFRRDSISHVVDADYVGKSWISPRNSRTTSAEFSDLDGLLNGATDKQTLTTAQDRVAGVRFLGSRGDRIINGWQAENIPRGLRFSAFARQAMRNFDYRSIAFRLWSRYLLESEFQELQQFNGSLPAAQQLTNLQLEHVGNGGANAAITFIHAGIPAGAIPINPEDLMWTDAAQAGLRAGTKQFVDARDLSSGELVELLSVIDSTNTNNLLVAKYGPDDGRASYMHPLGRYKHEHNGVNEIFVHTGAAPLFTPAQQALIINSVHQRPDIGSISTLLRLLSVRHGAGEHLEFGLELAISRNSVFCAASAPSASPNVPNHRYLCSDGHFQLYLPRTYTASAYLDSFLTPNLVPTAIELAMDMKGIEFIHSSALTGFFRTVSMNWAAYALSMRGRHWQHRPQNEPIQRIRTFINIILRTFNYDKITDWSTVHANAMAHQYGYCPSPSVRSTEAGYLDNVTAEWLTPYFSNHYLELWAMEYMPTFQVLPYFDSDMASSHISWPTDLPNPIPAYESFASRVRLARDTPVFSRELWKTDGGYMRNAQFYASAGRNDLYRFQGNPVDISLMRWQGDRLDLFPTAPAAQNPIWMGALNSPFSDYLLPGSIAQYNFATNRLNTFGIQANGQVDRLTKDRWFAIAKQESHKSLMVNYIHPTKDRRQLENQLEYSTLILERDNTYSGIVVVPHSLPDYQVDANFDPKAPDLNSVFSTTMPTATSTPLAEIMPDRIAKRAKPGSRVANIAKKPLVSQTRRLSPSDTHAAEVDIRYEPNNPEVIEDVPDLDIHHATISRDGIGLNPGPPPRSAQLHNKQWEDIVLPEATSGYDYDLEQRRSAELDNDFQVFLAESRAKQERFKRERAERDQRVSLYRQSPKRVRYSSIVADPAIQEFSSPKAAQPSGTTQVKPVYGRFPVKSIPPVVPNDSDAGFTQARAVEISRQNRSLGPLPELDKYGIDHVKQQQLLDSRYTGPEPKRPTSAPPSRPYPPSALAPQYSKGKSIDIKDDQVLYSDGAANDITDQTGAATRSKTIEGEAVKNDVNYVTASKSAEN
jgi:hypothetical protein